MFCNIIIPISIKIGETALAGTILMIGINKIEIRNINPVTILVKPVLPPAVIPAAASTDATVGLVPKIPEDKTETAVACRDFLLLSGRFSILLCPWIKPIFSNTITNAKDMEVNQKITFPAWSHDIDRKSVV